MPLNVVSVNGKTRAVQLDAGDLNVDDSAQTPKTVSEALDDVSRALNDLGGSIAPVETTATATAAHAVGELFVLGETLMVALYAIAIGDTITTEGQNPNAAVTTLSNKLIKDVQVNGTSVVQDGVANVPQAGTNKYGVAKAGNYGVYNYNGVLRLEVANETQCKQGSDTTKAIAPSTQHNAAFYGLAKIAGADEKNSSLPAGQYTESAKSAISQMLNAPEIISGTTVSIPAKAGVTYKCGEVSTLSITLPASGDVEVIFDSGSTPTALTFTLPTGVTALSWSNGFDPTSLEANTRYDLIITDGEWGIAAAWAV